MHYFLHFSIRKNAFTITRNALVLQQSPPTPTAGVLPLHPHWGLGGTDPVPPSTIFWIRHWFREDVGSRDVRRRARGCWVATLWSVEASGR